MKQYQTDIEEESMKLGEPAAVAYRSVHPSVGRRMQPKVEEKLTAEEYARKICFSDEEFEALKAKDFYQWIVPNSEQHLDEQDEVRAMDEADEEGYVSGEEVNHLRNVWKCVN